MKDLIREKEKVGPFECKGLEKLLTYVREAISTKYLLYTTPLSVLKSILRSFFSNRLRQ